MYNKEQLIKDITEYCNNNDVDITDAFTSTEWEWDKDLQDYINYLDLILSQVSDHWVILVDNWDEFSAQYQCSEYINNKYITIVVDNSFEQSRIESIEDIAYIINEMEINFQNIINIICEKD